MHIISKTTLIGTIALISLGCTSTGGTSDKLKLFEEYFATAYAESGDKWNYLADTVRVWFDDTSNKPSLKVKGVVSKDRWKEWDEVMNSTITYDSIWYDQDENAVKGYFYENNDFYKLIGRKPAKTLRTYWYNESNKIKGLLLYWIPEENTTSDIHLKPIVEWALKNDSTEIRELYRDDEITPSRENALRWKVLLERYNSSALKKED